MANTDKKVNAIALLKAVIQHDEPMVDTLIEEFNVNPNCIFDGIPLLMVACEKDAPLSIIKKLVRNGADVSQPVWAPVNGAVHCMDSAKNEDVKNYLKNQFRKIVDTYDDDADPTLSIIRELEEYELKQFGRQNKRFVLKDPGFYLGDKNAPDFGNDNGICISLQNDRPLCLIETKDEVVKKAQDNPLSLDKEKMNCEWPVINYS